jgi:hypothetical protein|tara:strand:+ start:61 stop:534 length:474 start_codon:yes stop_codon:yes gene_type:complete
MPEDRRKSIPKKLKDAAALKRSRDKATRKAKRAKAALLNLLFKHEDEQTRKDVKKIQGVGVDIELLATAAYFDLARLAESLGLGLISAERYANKRLAYLDLLRRLGIASDKISPPPASTLNCIVPPTEPGEEWYIDPETGEPLGREALNPDLGEDDE